MVAIIYMIVAETDPEGSEAYYPAFMKKMEPSPDIFVLRKVDTIPRYQRQVSEKEITGIVDLILLYNKNCWVHYVHF